MDADRKLTPEEVEVKKKEIAEYYKSNLGHLKVQAEYEALLADIEESRARRLKAQLYIAHAMAPSEPKEDSKAKEEFLKAKKED